MDVSRRNFLKGSGLAAGSLALTGKVAQSGEIPAEMRTKGLKHTTTICPYCAVGCGMIVHTKDGKIVNIEGDTEHPINQGALCSKGSALFQVANNEHRLTKVQYRAPKSDHWEEKSWDWALTEIAKRVKRSRDASFTAKNAKGQVVNRTNGIAHVGSAALDNEECWALQTMMRALGLGYIEHQARI